MKQLSEDVDIFKNFEISDPKSQNFQNVENLKNHVFDVFRWIWQVFFSFIFIFLSIQLCHHNPACGAPAP